MKTIGLIVFILTLQPAVGKAQTEVDDRGLSGGVSTFQPASPHAGYMADTLLLHANPQFTTPQLMKEPGYGQHNGFVESSKAGGTAFPLWKNAYLGVVGSSYHLPGLLDTSSGAVTLYQDLGRWHFTASGIAEKYWMPWQRSLSTQYGFGGTMGYDVSDALSLHAFGYYYANRIQVGPAMSPFLNTTTFGGYADIRFSNAFGSKVGIRRYMNPMTGRWTNEPIVNPYIKIGDSKIELPLGGLLKSLVWGDSDNPMRYRQHPMSTPNPIRPQNTMSRPQHIVRPPVRR